MSGKRIGKIRSSELPLVEKALTAIRAGGGWKRVRILSALFCDNTICKIESALFTFLMILQRVGRRGDSSINCLVA